MRKTLLIVMLAGMLAATAHAQLAGLAEVSTTGDADHFSAFRIRGGALLDYDTPLHYVGVAAQTTHYTRSGWRADAPAVLVLWRNQKPVTLEGVSAEAGVVRVSGRNRLIGDAAWSFRPAVHTGITLLASGDIVETRPAIENATAYDLEAVSVEQDLGKRVTAIGLAGVQHFTDGNDRTHLRGRVIFVVAPEQGLSVQLRWRQYDSSQLDVGRAYFNPEHYREWQSGLSMRKRYAGWVWSGTLAAGREQIDRGTDQTTKLADLRAEGPIGKAHLTVYASYNRSAGFGTTNDYWYRTLGVSVVVPF